MREPSSPASDDALARSLFEAFLTERLGHVLKPWPASLEREIATLVRERNTTVLEIARRVREKGIGTRILESATVGYTEFFRHTEHFARLRAFLASRTGVVTIHSAGCSTGEEPYSIAMTALSLGRRVQIVASDINAASVERARIGEYPKGPPGAPQGRWRAPDDVRAMIDWHVAPLASASATPRFDLVMCRNVLIYFDASGVKTIVDQLANQLLPDGRLVVAPVEALVISTERLVHEEPLGWMHVRSHVVHAPVPAPKVVAPVAPAAQTTDAVIEIAARALSMDALDVAESRLREALRDRPSSAEAWFLLGEVLERRGEVSQSRAAFACAARYADGAHDALAHAAARRAGR